jgi:hypothetical protein
MNDPAPLDSIERRTILEVLDQVCPLETELVGPTTVDDIIDGAHFKPVQGGSHFQLAIAIALVSCICSLTQLAIKTWELKQAARKEREKETAPSSERDQTIQIVITEHLALHPELVQVLFDHRKTPGQVIRSIQLVLASNSAELDKNDANPG